MKQAVQAKQGAAPKHCNALKSTSTCTQFQFARRSTHSNPPCDRSRSAIRHSPLKYILFMHSLSQPRCWGLCVDNGSARPARWLHRGSPGRLHCAVTVLAARAQHQIAVDPAPAPRCARRTLLPGPRRPLLAPRVTGHSHAGPAPRQRSLFPAPIPSPLPNHCAAPRRLPARPPAARQPRSGRARCPSQPPRPRPLAARSSISARLRAPSPPPKSM
jgi:hypothetical protein